LVSLILELQILEGRGEKTKTDIQVDEEGKKKGKRERKPEVLMASRQKEAWRGVNLIRFFTNEEEDRSTTSGRH